MSTLAVQPERLWFLDALVTIPVAHADGKDGVSVIEATAPYGDSPPLHVHRSEDEIFHVLEGELRLQVGGRAAQLSRRVARRRALARRHDERRLRAGRPHLRSTGRAARPARARRRADTGADRGARSRVPRVEDRPRRPAASLIAARSRRRRGGEKPRGEDADDEQRLGDEHARSFRRLEVTRR